MALPITEELEFPLEWQGKIIAHDLDTVQDDVRKTLVSFGKKPDVTRGNASSKGRYVTYNLTLIFEDRTTMQQITHALSQVNGVRMVI